jgi:hypothetical protein
LIEEQERKRIEQYIDNDFLPKFFDGFEVLEYKFSKNSHYRKYFEYQEIEYLIEILRYGDNYEGYLCILDEVGAEMVFSNKGSLEEFFLIANKSMKQYKLSKLYK